MPKGISVVILTHNRVELARRLFASLDIELKSNREKTLLEVIVVDDSHAYGKAVIESLCRQFGYSFYFYKGNLSAKRNFGIDKARNEIILFIDSDCEVLPGLLQEHINSYTDESIGGVLGVTNFVGKRSWGWKVIEKTPFIIGFSFPERTDYAPWGPCTNISFRKAVLEGIGGFDTDFSYSGEDVDIGVRVNKAGYKIRCNPKAIVNHATETWSNLLQSAMKFFRWGRTDFHILKKHPHLKSIEFPKFFTVLVLVLLMCLAEIFTGHSDIAAKTIAVWIPTALLLEAIFKVAKAREKPPLIFSEFLSTLLNLTFEAGTILESLRRGSLSMLYQKILYSPGQLIAEWDSRVVRSWSIIIALLLTLVVIYTT